MAISAMSQLGILRIGVQEAGMEVRFSGNANQYHVYHNGEPFAFLSLTGICGPYMRNVRIRGYGALTRPIRI
jgi:hypothetical protein